MSPFWSETFEWKQFGKCFSQGGLKRHKRVHTGEKGYAGKWFSRCSGQLRSLRMQKNARKVVANSTGDNILMGRYKKHICCISKEELRTEVLLLEHYKSD